jgi:hypothetical protein
MYPSNHAYDNVTVLLAVVFMRVVEKPLSSDRRQVTIVE